MPKTKNKDIDNSEISITVEDELVEDLEQVNFGAKGLEVVEIQLREANEAIWEKEEKKAKVLGKSQKIVGKKLRESEEKTVERLSDDLEKTLPRRNLLHHAPTFRNK
jgi:Na+/phosphate symporter